MVIFWKSAFLGTGIYLYKYRMYTLYTVLLLCQRYKFKIIFKFLKKNISFIPDQMLYRHNS